MDGSAAAITCYGGVFLTKMLAELNQSPPLGAARKTQQHVRWHLLPYLGGAEALSTLKTDSPRDSNCTACVTDEATFEGLSALRASVPGKLRRAYDELGVCYMQLTDTIINLLPKDKSGVFLVPRQPAVSPAQQTLDLFKTLFQRGCHLEGCASRDFTECTEASGTEPEPRVPPGVTGCEPAASNTTAPVCGLHRTKWVNGCDGGLHGFQSRAEAAVFCFVSSFIQKMLVELTVSPPMGTARKTEQHVRSHLTAYMGGNVTTAAVKTDRISDPNCTVCWSDPICAVHQLMWIDTPCCFDTDLPGWQEGVCPDSIPHFRDARDTYYRLGACYAPWTNYIMEALPKAGKWLVPPRDGDTPYTLTRKIVGRVIAEHGIHGCD